MKTQFDPHIADPLKVKKLEKEFENTISELNKQKYISIMEERKRLNKILMSYKIAKPIEIVWPKLLSILLKDLHPSLKIENVNKGDFYITSNSKDKLPFRIKNYDDQKTITIEWISKKQWFTRTINVKQIKNNSTKIFYMDISKGEVSVAGYFERRVIFVYNKRQVIAFTIQMLNLKIDLELVPSNKIEKIKNKIEKMLKYSQKLY
ncbi:hypothetical protein [Spiroplasma endosymbiont of Labia minor]|uniref:hypothetical protein n=1 Tax=Spiroplasma endosymbiont of Labia minor TaxID=3066305 RepID=UPI0030CB7BD7